jgi:acyl-CoA synthetase (AMP-forming)/AMP-acid ligase II
MRMRKSIAGLMLFGLLLAGCLFVSTTPASANTSRGFTFQLTCAQAQSVVNFLLSLDEQLEALVAANPNNTFLAEEAPELDQYISNAIQFVESHTAGPCTFNTEDE